MKYVWHFTWAIGSFFVLYAENLGAKIRKFLTYCQRKSWGPPQFRGQVIDFGKDTNSEAYIVVLKLEKGHPYLLKEGLEKTGQKLIFTTQNVPEPTPAEIEAIKNLVDGMSKTGFSTSLKNLPSATNESTVPYSVKKYIGELYAKQNL